MFFPEARASSLNSFAVNARLPLKYAINWPSTTTNKRTWTKPKDSTMRLFAMMIPTRRAYYRLLNCIQSYSDAFITIVWFLQVYVEGRVRSLSAPVYHASSYGPFQWGGLYHVRLLLLSFTSIYCFAGLLIWCSAKTSMRLLHSISNNFWSVNPITTLPWCV